MEIQTIKAESRSAKGKGPARQARMQGSLPAVFYAPGKEPKMLSVTPDAVEQALTTPRRRNAVMKLAFAQGGEELVMIKELQMDPLRKKMLHVDFYGVDENKLIQIEVPFRANGRAAGVIKGGDQNVVYRSVPVRCTPLTVPASIEVDVTNLDLLESITTQDLELPDGVEVLLDPKRTLVTIAAERKRTAMEEEADAADAAAAGAAADAAAAAAEAETKTE